jgi:hypothetical protein
MARSLAQPREAPTASLRFGRSGESGDEPALQLERLIQARQGGGDPHAARAVHRVSRTWGHSPQIRASKRFHKVLRD